ncbi:MAG: TolC family protein [Akkermansiaceae bacterium]|nr:TolC family protein [Akkermansiaceae bacterium]
MRWYPRLNLEAGVGVTADRVGNLDRSNAREGNIGLRITFPLIDHGKRKAKLDEAQANFRETIQLQRQQILAAQADAETALGKVHWTAKQSELTTRSATAAGKASALSMKRYEAGNMDVFQYLVLERSHLNASRSAVRARTAQLRANVALIRALGGGWTAANASTK